MAASKKKAQSGVAISKKFNIPSKTGMSPSLRQVPGTGRSLTDAQKDSVIKSWQSNKINVPTRKTTRSYTGVSQAEGDDMLNSFKKKNPGFKSGGTVKKKKK